MPKAETGLPQDSVANVSLTVALDKQVLTDRVRKIPRRRLELVFAGIDTILGR
jgi:mRNA-degrading endonuclease toxin of MazEF toxin-antitoxin module